MHQKGGPPSVRTVDRIDSGKKRSHTERCKEQGCNNTTRECKPYCPVHVEQHEYVGDILDRLSKQAEQEEQIRRRGASAVTTELFTSQEILLHLELNGCKTVERLARELNKDAGLIDLFTKGLCELKRVKRRKSSRGNFMVDLW